jgi:hypothetical protein
MNKKGFFFTIDVFMALGVLIVGFLLILATHTFKPIETQTIFFSQDLLEVFASTEVDQINNPTIFKMRCNSCECGEYCGAITTIDNTLLEQLGEFVYRHQQGCGQKCLDYATDLAKTTINSKTKGLINPQFSYELIIKDKEQGSQYVILNKTLSNQGRTKLLITNKRLIYGISGSREMFGPYVAEVHVWQ